MIYFILLWTILIIVAYPIGLLVINQLSVDSFGRWGDRFIASSWLGIVILAAFLLAISLILPLSPLVGGGVAGILVVVSLVSSRTQAEITQLRTRLSSKILSGIAILGLIVALLTTDQVTWIESGFYHYGSIRWLSEFGTVPGIVLVLPNFGIISTWFALNAPLNGSIIDFKAGVIANGFIFFLALLHTIVCLFHLLTSHKKLSDYFAISFYSLFFLYTALSLEMQLIVVSPSPDLPTILLTAIIAWAILVTVESRTASSEKLDGSIVPLLLAAGAVTIKLSALPLLLVTCIFYCFQVKFQIKQLLFGLCLTSLLLLPIVLVGFQTSGCPLYPSPLFCVDVPWSQSIEDTQKFADRTQNPAKWIANAPPNQNSPFWVFGKWLQARALNQIMAALVVISLFCLIYLIQIKAIFRRNSGIFWLSALGVSGILFIIFKGPLIRFGLGYLLLLPALSMAVYADRKNLLAENGESIWRNILGKWDQIQAITLGILATVMVISFGYGQLSSRWLLPPKVAYISVIPKQVNDIKYVTPENGACWASPLPCTAKKWVLQAKLRHPSLGIKGGFVRGGG
ncbi:LIC_10190 family membrane protein [Merismopedia glauca]